MAETMPASMAMAVDGPPVPETSAPEIATEAKDESGSPPPTGPKPTETIYIQNLNEKIRIPIMKETLTNLFSNYGPILDVIAHRSIRMRGQAFVAFEDAETAAKAQREVNRFPLYNKPMQISFAKTRADAVVKKFDPNNFEGHKTERLDRKKKSRTTNPIRIKLRAKKLEAAGGAGALPAGVAGGPTTTRRPAVQMPDEYLPPNKILFLQNLPEGVTKDQLEGLFSQYPNLHEVRLIPTKKDIAFVEYMDEGSATVAKEALHNHKLDGESKIKITYARK